MRVHAARQYALILLLLFACFSLFAQSTPPVSVDWRSSGAVGPVKNGEQCGASWAFAAAAAVEGAKAVKTKHLFSLSEQELIDCTTVEGNHGCAGGSVDGAFHWIARHGIAATSAYPYTGRDGTCHLGRPSVVTIGSFHQVPTDMLSLMAAVAKQPVAVEIDGSSREFQEYGGGIYACHGGTPNFWVTIVGYGKDAAGRTYWLVKAALGTEWGEHGYMRMTRSADCHSIGAAVVPVL